MYDGHAETVRRLFVLCMKELKRTQCSLSESYKKQDIAGLKAELHRCLGGILYFRCPDLEHALRAFQKALKVSRFGHSDIEKSYIALESAMTELLAAWSRGDFDPLVKTES